MWYKIIISIIMLFICCSPRYNVQKDKNFEPKPIIKVEQDDKALIFLSLSGGGSRAATMSWRALEHLKTIPYNYVNKDGKEIKSNLADQIDYISGISGGSFAATAWCIYKDSMDVFRKKFINQNIQAKLALRALIPWVSLRLIFSKNYDRINIAADYYNKHVFDEKTFNEISSYPVLWVNSTHLALGIRFTYTQDYFDLLDSDLNKFPVGFACAASSAFPGLLSPMTLRNFGESISDSIMMQDVTYRMAKKNSRRDLNKEFYCKMREFYNDKTNKWMHYADGGLVDNQGLKVVIDNFGTNGIINKALNNSENSLKRLIIINVNAGTDKDDKSCKKKDSPKLFSVLKYTMTTSMDVLSSERWMYVKELCNELNKATIDAKNDGEPNALLELEKPYCIEVNARNLQEENLKNEFNELPTSFHMNKKQIALIDSVTPILIDEDLDMQRLIKVMK